MLFIYTSIFLLIAWVIHSELRHRRDMKNILTCFQVINDNTISINENQNIYESNFRSQKNKLRFLEHNVVYKNNTFDHKGTAQSVKWNKKNQPKEPSDSI